MNFGEPPTESSFTPFPKGTIDVDDGLTHGCAGDPHCCDVAVEG